MSNEFSKYRDMPVSEPNLAFSMQVTCDATTQLFYDWLDTFKEVLKDAKDNND